MRLLVSVRSAVEARDALRGGADIIDAKDPSRGPLGPVSADTLAEIDDVVPEDQELSLALGDFAVASDVERAVSSLQLRATRVSIYLKVGLAGASRPDAVESVLTAAVACSTMTSHTVRVIAVGYADWNIAATVSPETLCRAAANAGCSGVLLDTYSKRGATLLDWIEPPELERWVSRARRAGLSTALAGSLGVAHLPLVSSAAPDVVGVRGAACEGGRDGKVSAAKVATLRDTMINRSASLQGQLSQ